MTAFNVRQKIIVICGPTAAGKTGLGLRLCREFGGELISADSQQVYMGMDIGTAKDNLAGQGVKCHLIDVVEPSEPFDAAKFKELADRAIADITSKGRVPFIVGGTGFYIWTLLEGLSEAPGRDEKIRSELMRIKDERGRAALYDILKEEDPDMAERLHPNDFTRVIRAIEVKRLTGESLSRRHCERERSNPVHQHYNTLKIGLNIDRNVLYERINARVDRMIEGGLVDEVKGIVAKYGGGLQSLKAVGYKEIVRYLKGEMGLAEAVELTKRNTRRFAKRQLTWFRADPDIGWYSPEDYSIIAGRVRNFLS